MGFSTFKSPSCNKLLRINKFSICEYPSYFVTLHDLLSLMKDSLTIYGHIHKWFASTTMLSTNNALYFAFLQLNRALHGERNLGESTVFWYLSA